VYQAGYKYSTNWEPLSPKPETNVRTVRKTCKKVNTKRKFVIKAGASLFIYALVLVFFCMKSSSLGYQIVALENNIQQIETSNNRMEYQIAQKSSLQRIEKIAAKDLGMYKPGTNEDIAVESQQQSVTANRQNPISQSKIAEKPLNKVYSALQLLAQKDNN
jgi:cell division protein FtsL